MNLRFHAGYVDVWAVGGSGLARASMAHGIEEMIVVAATTPSAGIQTGGDPLITGRRMQTRGALLT
jgi:hypothetical protein